MSKLIDGKALAKLKRQQIKEQAALLPRRPGLAVIMVGDDPASRLYVANKERDCSQCGISSREYLLPRETSQDELLEMIRLLNRNDQVDGILLQLPLPSHIDEQPIIQAIAPDKDVDAFHPENVGRMITGEPLFWPCTPGAIMELLHEYQVPIAGRRCVVVGRSNIVGKPMALLLLRESGTVTICHSHTEDLAAETRQADILVSAAGSPGLIRGDMVKPGAVVIDVAMNLRPEGGFCGDAIFAEVEPIASLLTPVPGGVGPMTRAVLLGNILSAARHHLGL